MTLQVEKVPNLWTSGKPNSLLVGICWMRQDRIFVWIIYWIMTSLFFFLKIRLISFEYKTKSNQWIKPKKKSLFFFFLNRQEMNTLNDKLKNDLYLPLILSFSFSKTLLQSLIASSQQFNLRSMQNKYKTNEQILNYIQLGTRPVLGSQDLHPNLWLYMS